MDILGHLFPRLSARPEVRCSDCVHSSWDHSANLYFCTAEACGSWNPDGSSAPPLFCSELRGRGGVCGPNAEHWEQLEGLAGASRDRQAATRKD